MSLVSMDKYFQVVPKLDFKMLGTFVKLKAGEPYWAIHATNQPDWQEQGKIFVFFAGNGDPVILDRVAFGNGFLLHKGDYLLHKGDY